MEHKELEEKCGTMKGQNEELRRDVASAYEAMSREANSPVFDQVLDSLDAFERDRAEEVQTLVKANDSLSKRMELLPEENGELFTELGEASGVVKQMQGLGLEYAKLQYENHSLSQQLMMGGGEKQDVPAPPGLEGPPKYASTSTSTTASGFAPPRGLALPPGLAPPPGLDSRRGQFSLSEYTLPPQGLALLQGSLVSSR